MSYREEVEYLNNHGIYIFMDEVSLVTIKPVTEWILHENFVSKEKRKELLLIICSPGGDVSSAFALIDIMNSSNLPIKTVGLGQICSAGLLIFMNGSKGKRVLTPNTSILSHQFSWGHEGKAHELFATISEFNLTQQRILKHYIKCTELSESVIKEQLLPAQDRWLSCDEALHFNICDIISSFDIDKPTKNLKTKIVK